MLQAFNRIGISVPDLEAAVATYSALLGEFDVAGNRATLSLANVDICLSADAGSSEAHIDYLELGDSELAAGDRTEIANDRALRLFRSGPPREYMADCLTATGVSAVDHLVVRSSDGDGCIDLFGKDGLGMRLALDQQVPEWGGRMLFFRFAKMTLEIIHNQSEPPEHDQFWGITYLCPDLEHTLAQLDRAGIEHSPLRTGRKPGTLVATVHSHALGLPTLLIQPAPAH